MRHSVRELIGGLGTTLRRACGVSDWRRWGTNDRLSEDWGGRTKLIATLIAPGSSVLEFGAGRMVLKKHLPASCRYTPSDIVDRGPATIVGDLNARIMPIFPPHDVAVFSGVLEYVKDLPRLVAILAKTVDMVVASYVDSDSVPRKIARRAHGWVNDYSREQLQEIFRKHGFMLVSTHGWRNQKVYLLSRVGLDRCR